MTKSDKVGEFPATGAAQPAHSGVGAGTHTPAPEAAPADLFGAAVEAEPVKAVGSRAGRPNKLNRIMAAKVEAEHGTSVLQELVRMGMASEVDLAKEAVAYAKAMAEALGPDKDGKAQHWHELTGSLTFGALRRYRLECLATAAPYLHAKRAPENGKGQMQPVMMVFGGMSSADLGRVDGAFSDDAMVIDLEAEVLGLPQQNQALGETCSDDGGPHPAGDGETASDNSEVAQ